MLGAMKSLFSGHSGRSGVDPDIDANLRKRLLTCENNDSNSLMHFDNTHGTVTAKLGSRAEKSLPLTVEKAFSLEITASTNHGKSEKLLDIRDGFINTCEKIIKDGEIGISEEDGHVGQAFQDLLNSLKLEGMSSELIHYAAFFKAAGILCGFTYDQSKIKAIDLLMDNIFKIKLPLKAVQQISHVLIDNVVSLKALDRKTFFLGKFAEKIAVNAGLEKSESKAVLSDIKQRIASTKNKELIRAYSEALSVNN